MAVGVAVGLGVGLGPGVLVAVGTGVIVGRAVASAWMLHLVFVSSCHHFYKKLKLQK